jgi:hypothetical protein
MTKWIKCSERLPNSDRQVLVKHRDGGFHDRGHIYATACYSEKYKGWETDHFCESGTIDGVTHWAEIEPPEVE